MVLGVSRRLLTRRSGVRFQLDHVLFILSVRHAIPSYCVWKRICSVRNEGRPAAGNQRQARKWRRRVSSKRTKEAQRSTLNQSKKDVLGGDGQNAWLNVYICGIGDKIECPTLMHTAPSLLLQSNHLVVDHTCSLTTHVCRRGNTQKPIMCCFSQYITCPIAKIK